MPAPDTIQIRNHTRSVWDIETNVYVDPKTGAVVDGKAPGAVRYRLLLGGSDDGAAVRGKKPAPEGTTYLDNRTDVPRAVWAKIGKETAIAALLESHEFEAVG